MHISTERFIYLLKDARSVSVYPYMVVCLLNYGAVEIKNIIMHVIVVCPDRNMTMNILDMSKAEQGNMHVQVNVNTSKGNTLQTSREVEQLLMELRTSR